MPAPRATDGQKMREAGVPGRSWRRPSRSTSAAMRGRARPAPAALAGRRGPVLYVAAQRVHRSPRALANAPGGGRILVVPGELAGRRPSFSVAGCHGYELSGTRAAHARKVLA